MTTMVPDLRLPPEEYFLRKIDINGIPVVEDLVQSRNRPPPEEYPPRKVGVRGIPLEEGLLQQQKRHQRVCEAAGNSSEEYLKNTPNLYLLALGSPIAHYQVWNTHCGRPDRKRTRPPPEEYPLRKVGVRGIPLEEDLAQKRNRPPPEEYPLRKTDLRGIPVVEDLAQKKDQASGRGIPLEEDRPPWNTRC